MNTPSNPSGKIFSLPNLKRLPKSPAHDLFVFTDEIYEYFVYDGAAPCQSRHIARHARAHHCLSGFSKTFSVTGWRLGYVTADASWLPP
jgi:aminotransferase